MKSFNRAILISVFLGISTTATATNTTWDFRAGSSDYTSIDGDISNDDGTNGGDFGNTFELTSGGVNLSITAWADTASDNTYDTSYTDGIEDANLSRNSGGLLNYNRFYNIDDHQGHPSDDHAVDNSQGAVDMLFFEFSEMVSLIDVSIGWFSNDSDISVVGFDSLPTLNSSTWGTLANNASFAQSYTDLANSNYSATVNSGYESKYWLIGAYNNAFSDNWSMGNDHIKIAGLTTRLADITDGNQNSTPVSSPGTFSLFFVAAGGLLLRRRKFK